MATGDGAERSARRARLTGGELGTAPVVYLPGAAAASSDRDTAAGPSRSRSESRGAHPAGIRWNGDASASSPADRPAADLSMVDGSAAGSSAAGLSSIDGAYGHEVTTGGTRRHDSATGAAAPSDRTTRRAANVSMSALARRGMSRWELEKTLVSRELEPGVVEEELDRLAGVGLIDDGALAETLVRTQHERKGLGRSALTAELRRRHIDQEHIDAALEQVDDDDEAARAAELAERRARQLSSLDWETAQRRLTGYLMRKGYSSSIVRAAVQSALPPRGGGVRFR